MPSQEQRSQSKRKKEGGDSRLKREKADKLKEKADKLKAKIGWNHPHEPIGPSALPRADLSALLQRDKSPVLKKVQPSKSTSKQELLLRAKKALSNTDSLDTELKKIQDTLKKYGGHGKIQ